MRISRAALNDSASGDGEEYEEEEVDDENEDSERTSDDEKYDDPETADLEADRNRVQDDEEIDSDEAFGVSDEELFKSFALRGSSKPNIAVAKNRRPRAADFMSSSDDEDTGKIGEDAERNSTPSEEDDGTGSGAKGSGAKLNGVYDDRSEESVSDMDVDSDDEEIGGSDSDQSGSSFDKATVPSRPKILKPRRDVESRKQEQAVASAISDFAKQKIAKGQAVRQQRKLHDGLMSVRMKMHKALGAANTLHLGNSDGEDLESGALESAELAAVRLWNLLDDFAQKTRGSQLGQKRKRAIDSSTTLETIWDYMQEDEKVAHRKRQKNLDNWSSKADWQTRIGAQHEKKLERDTKLSLSAALDRTLLLDSTKLIKRSIVPHDCAPTQRSQGVEEDTLVYDDSDFYKALLKELVDQRASDTTIQGAGVPTVEWTPAKEPKTRKNVDRKASRGRKMRFNVHEKLAGFTAPEDRRSWEQASIDRFFATLFGKKLELDEESDGSEDEIKVEEAGLRLFRA